MQPFTEIADSAMIRAASGRRGRDENHCSGSRTLGALYLRDVGRDCCPPREHTANTNTILRLVHTWLHVRSNSQMARTVLNTVLGRRLRVISSFYLLLFVVSFVFLALVLFLGFFLPPSHIVSAETRRSEGFSRTASSAFHFPSSKREYRSMRPELTARSRKIRHFLCPAVRGTIRQLLPSAFV